jgi:hypothetical protein
MTSESHIEQLASANAKPAVVDLMAEWDAAVAARAERDKCPRDAAVDRLLATPAGSSLWNKANMWWAAQPRTVVENGREVRSGNWQNSGFATLRRIPRRP